MINQSNLKTFAPNLMAICLGHNIVGEEILKGLLPALSNLNQLDLTYCKIKDIGCKMLAELKTLKPASLNLYQNEITDEGIKFLLKSNFCAKLKKFELSYNSISDGAFINFELDKKIPLLEELWLRSTQITDRTIENLAKTKILNRLQHLDLAINRLTDKTAETLIKSQPKNLETLLLEENGISPKIAEDLLQYFKFIKNLAVYHQDLGKKLPEIAGNKILKLKILNKKLKPDKGRTVPKWLKKIFSSPDWVGFDKSSRKWALGLKYKNGKYQVSLVDADTKKVLASKPAIIGEQFNYSFSSDNRYCGIIACQGYIYIIDLESGKTEKLGKTFYLGNHDWCGEKFVVLDCDVMHGHKHYISVYGQKKGKWTREYFAELQGKYTYDLAIISNHRILACNGDEYGGVVFVAISDKGVRCLGSIPYHHYNAYDSSDKTVVRRKEYSEEYYYELINIDEALKEAFSTGSSPKKILLPKIKE